MKRVVFVCVENACRSQMAAGFARRIGASKVEVWSAGSRPAGKINETAVRLMAEKGIDLLQDSSKGLDALPPGGWAAVVTMGCGDACPALPAARREDWTLPDPKLLPDDDFRRIRDDIESRVAALIASL